AGRQRFHRLSLRPVGLGLPPRSGHLCHRPGDPQIRGDPAPRAGRPPPPLPAGAGHRHHRPAG
ncbi:MAG: hypothetical protein AVDCRST_MAG88-3724, partial [uncultured Thermomicrobiales bacterium]